MNDKTLDKVTQTFDLFNQIINPLKRNFDLSFGYMIVFPDGRYYTLVDDMKCLEEFVSKVNESHIFSHSAISTFFDDEYYFSFWPETPCCEAMQVYYRYNQWNGITVSKTNENYTELWWFAGDKVKQHLQSFLFQHKNMLLEFIYYFNSHKSILAIPNSMLSNDLFRFKYGFEIDLTAKKYKQEKQKINNFINFLQKNNLTITEIRKLKQRFSPREIEILSIMCHGFSSKTISQKLHISTKTTQHHIEHIKQKTGLHFKEELIKFYQNDFKD